MPRLLRPLLLLLLLLLPFASSFFLLPFSPPPPSFSSSSTPLTRCQAHHDRRSSLSFLALSSSSAAAAFLLLSSPLPTFAATTTTNTNTNTQATTEALKRVIIVRDSTQQLEEELTNGDSYPDVRALITSLLRNYKLKESLSSALPLLPTKEVKEDAQTHAKMAYENLIIVLEYYPESQDGPLKNKTLKPDEVAFTIKALQASRKELSAYLSSFSQEVVKGLTDEVAAT